MLLLKILQFKKQASEARKDPVGLGLDVGLEALSAVFIAPLLGTGALTLLFGILRFGFDIPFFGFLFWFMLVVSLIWLGIMISVRRGIKRFTRTTEMHMRSRYADKATGEVIDVTVDNEPGQ